MRFKRVTIEVLTDAARKPYVLIEGYAAPTGESARDASSLDVKMWADEITVTDSRTPDVSPEVLDARRLSRILFEARERVEMHCDMVEARTGTRDELGRRVIGEIDTYRREQGWTPDGFGREAEGTLARVCDHYGLPHSLDALLRHLEGNRALVEATKDGHIDLLTEALTAVVAACVAPDGSALDYDTPTTVGAALRAISEAGVSVSWLAERVGSRYSTD